MTLMRRSLLLAAACALLPVSFPSGARAAEPTTLTVFAAASLREVFTVLVADFERAHPDAKVRFSYAGTQELRLQLEHGAEADVMAAADTKHMDALLAQGLVLPPKTFAHNQLVIIVPKANPAALKALADLPKASRIVIGVPDVPVGAYTTQMLDRASAEKALGKDFRGKVEAKVVSRELNVKQVVAKVALGEADAAVVYETDAKAAADKVTALPIATAYNVVATYPVAVVKATKHKALAEAWLKALRGPAGVKALKDAGFRLPEKGS
jgi:molybdate transport system substrate-binding protein